MSLIKNFSIPDKVEVEESTSILNFGKFIISPYHSGFGHTIGNALRRILLSSIDGLSVYSVRISGINNEFSTVLNVVEDVSEIILNIKQIIFHNLDDNIRYPIKAVIKKNIQCEVKASDISINGFNIEVLNPDLHICTLHDNSELLIEMQIVNGIGYKSAEESKLLCNKFEQSKDYIPIDSSFSPVKRVKYQVNAARIGDKTEMDKLIMEIWTDGRIEPKDALKKSVLILIDHLNPFLDRNLNIDPLLLLNNDEDRILFSKLIKDVSILDLSVRAQNCLDRANITTIGELCVNTESKILQYKNFGKKSLEEIIFKLEKLELSLGMTFNEEVTQAMKLKSKLEFEEKEKEKNSNIS